MDCKQVQTLLSAYHDDQLSAESRHRVATHVQSCSRCGEELVLFGKLSGMAKRLADPEPPEAIWSRIEAGLDADPASASLAGVAPRRGGTARTVAAEPCCDGGFGAGRDRRRLAGHDDAARSEP